MSKKYVKVMFKNISKKYIKYFKTIQIIFKKFQKISNIFQRNFKKFYKYFKKATPKILHDNK